MPQINETADTIIFKVFPHYFEDIKSGRKTIDVRLLSSHWENILYKVSYIEFINKETEEKIRSKIVSLIPISLFNPSPELIIKGLFGDVDWHNPNNDKYFTFIKFEIENKNIEISKDVDKSGKVYKIRKEEM